ncbi:MAG: proton-conducting transporter membrane subunit [Desulfobacterium sp.]|jgi:multicomponent Na+:H+ antiporter subunit D|nr:proton-conducting transporter membrane subunit [Desulfobacterium sp.]
MLNTFPAIIIVVPLLAALLIAGISFIDRRACFPIGVVALLISFAGAAVMLFNVVSTGVAMEYRFGGWAGPMGIVYVIDHLSALVLVVITGIALVNLVSSRQTIIDELKEKDGAFVALYLLFTAGLVGMTATGDAFNLYVLLEITSLSGYALIGLGSERAPLASLKYLFLGTIGATFYLVGVGYLYIATGSLNMVDLATIIPGLMDSGVILFAFIFCMTGLFVKMAMFPVHGWLPGAYSEASSPAAGLIAPLTTKVMIYILIRICLSVFSVEYVFANLDVGQIMVWLAIATIVFGSVSALAQTNYRRMLTYIIIAEVGYMVGGFFLGNKMGMSGAMLHIVNDAVMTLCLFMVAGIVVNRMKTDDRDGFKGLFRSMPFTMAGFVLAALSIIGVPPTCGFFSKWYLILGGVAAGNYWFVAALIFSSLVNAVLFFRLFEIAYFEPFGDDHHGESPGAGAVGIKEAPMIMLLPFLAVSFLLIVLGVYSGRIVTNIIYFAIPGGII